TPPRGAGLQLQEFLRVGAPGADRGRADRAHGVYRGSRRGGPCGWVMHFVELLLFVAWVSLQMSATGPYLPPQPDLDLPVLPDTYHPDRLAPLPPTPEEGPDPRDEPVPMFYGEEIASESQSLVYVIDLSGSMDYGTRLETAR